MKDMSKTKAQLIEELEQLRHQIKHLKPNVSATKAPDRGLLSAIVSQMLEPTVVLDWEGNLLLGNRLAADVLGVASTDGIAGMRIVDILHPDSMEQAAVDLHRVKTAKAPFLAHYKLLIDGHTVDIESHGTKIELADGSVDLVSFRDVSRQFQTENALKRQKSLFKSLVENANDIIYTLQTDGTFLYISPNWKEMLGHDPKEVMGTKFMPYIHPEDLPRCMAFLEQVMQTDEKQQGLEYRVKHKDGTWRWHMTNASKMVTPEGETLYAGIARDISSRKRMENQLRESRTMLTSVLDNTSTVIFVKDLNGRYLLINKRYEELFGIKNEEIIGKTDFDVFPKEAAEMFQAKDRLALEKGAPIEEEEIVPHEDGHHTYISVKFPMLDAKGRAIATCGIATDITERKQAEESLKEARDELEQRVEERARELKAGQAFTKMAINSVPGLFYVFDLEGRLLRWNRRFTEVCGYSDDEIAERRLMDFFYKGDFPVISQAVKDVMEKGESAAEAHLVTKDGALLPYLFNGVRSQLGDNEYVVGMGLDISMRKRAEEALKTSERKFRSLAESTSAQITLVQDDVYIYANQAFLDYHGLDRDELALVDPEDMGMGMMSEKQLKKIAPIWQEALARGDDHFRIEYQDLDGNWFQSNVTIVELDGKECFMGMTFDITAFKQTQKELEESEKRYRTIFNASGAGMISFGADSVITLANEEWSKISGYSIEETVGKKTWMEFFSEKSLEKMRKFHEMRSQDPSSVPKAYEGQFIDRYAKVHDGIINVQVVPGTQQRVASFQDMTALKRAQNEMYRADKMAALGQIIAGVAHEINNPNNFIYFNLPILKKYIQAIRPMLEHHLEDEPDLRILNMPYEVFLEDIFKLLENMEHGSKRITSIVSELKTYVRSDEDAGMRVESLAPVIDRVMALVGKQVRKTVKRFDVNVAKGLLPIRMNPGKIEQVLINLVINAGQAADKEDSFVRLSASLQAQKENWIEIVVSDNGAGIPEEIRDQIFEPFFTSKGRDAGTGLGLSICHRVIEEHGGTIKVESTPGKGATFTICLPADTTQ